MTNFKTAALAAALVCCTAGAQAGKFSFSAVQAGAYFTLVDAAMPLYTNLSYGVANGFGQDLSINLVGQSAFQFDFLYVSAPMSLYVGVITARGGGAQSSLAEYSALRVGSGLSCALGSGHTHLKLLAERACGRLDLVKPGGVAQVKQPVDLRHVPPQASRQLCLLDALLGHRLVDAQFRPRQRRRAHGALPTLGLAGCRQVLACIHVERQRSLQRIHRVQKRFVFVCAERHCRW